MPMAVVRFSWIVRQWLPQHKFTHTLASSVYQEWASALTWVVGWWVGGWSLGDPPSAMPSLCKLQASVSQLQGRRVWDHVSFVGPPAPFLCQLTQEGGGTSPSIQTLLAGASCALATVDTSVQIAWPMAMRQLKRSQHPTRENGWWAGCERACDHSVI